MSGRVVDVHAHVIVGEIQAAVHDHPGLDALRALEALRNGPASAAVSRTMFAGRIGSVTLAAALAASQTTQLFTRPEERPIVG